MLNKNSLLTGILIALFFPVIAGLVAYLMQNDAFIINRPAFPYFIAVAINMVLIRIAIRRELDQTGRGIMMATFVIMLLIFILKIQVIR